MQFDRTKTLEQLEGHAWGAPNFPSHVVKECHRIRRKRIADFTNEELRLAISQQMGLTYLLPLAIERLNADPLTAGDYFVGDLLGAVLRVPKNTWVAWAEGGAAMQRVVERFFALSSTMDDAWQETYPPTYATLQSTFVILES